MKIPCLSLWQPWASLIGRGKSIETRHWKTNYRGPLAIHAAKRFDSEQAQYCACSGFYEILEAAGLVRRQVRLTGSSIRGAVEILDMPFGAVIAVCRLATIRPTDWIEESTLLPPGDVRVYQSFIRISQQEYLFGNYAPGRFAWFLEDIHILERPIAMRGEWGLFQVELPGLEVRP